MQMLYMILDFKYTGNKPFLQVTDGFEWLLPIPFPGKRYILSHRF